MYANMTDMFIRNLDLLTDALEWSGPHFAKMMISKIPVHFLLEGLVQKKVIKL